MKQRFVLVLIFVFSVGVFWLGTFASIDKSDLPALLFDGVANAEGLRTTMLELRSEVYQYYKNTGTENIVMSAYHGYVDPLKSHSVTVDLEGETVTMPSAVINEMRGSLLLHPYDEVNAIRALQQIRPRQWQFNPHIFQYGTVFIYLLGFGLLVAQKVGAFVLTSDMSYYLVHPNQMAKLYAVAKMWVGVMTALGVFPLYALGKFWKNRRVGLVAASLYPFVPLFFIFGHHMKPHGLAMPFALAAILLCLKAFLEQPTRKQYFVAGLVTGMCIGVIYTSVFIFPVLLMSYWFNAERSTSEKGTFVMALLGVGVGFLIFNPFYVLTPAEPLQELHTLFGRHVVTTSIPAKLKQFFGYEVQVGIGRALFFLSLLGMIVGFRDGQRSTRFLLATTVLSVIPTLINRGDAYYSGPTFALLLLWVGIFADRMVFSTPRSVTASFLLGITVVHAVLLQLTYVALYRQPQPEYDAAKWINTNIPKGATLVRIEEQGEHFSIPYRTWRYTGYYPEKPLRLESLGLPGALEADTLRVGSASAQYVLATTLGQLPTVFETNGASYKQVHMSRRYTQLQKFFPFDLFPYCMANFAAKIYVYERQP